MVKATYRSAVWLQKLDVTSFAAAGFGHGIVYLAERDFMKRGVYGDHFLTGHVDKAGLLPGSCRSMHCDETGRRGLAHALLLVPKHPCVDGLALPSLVAAQRVACMGLEILQLQAHPLQAVQFNIPALRRGIPLHAPSKLTIQVRLCLQSEKPDASADVQTRWRRRWTSWRGRLIGTMV